MYSRQDELILWKYRSQKSDYILGNADWKVYKGTFQNDRYAFKLLSQTVTTRHITFSLHKQYPNTVLSTLDRKTGTQQG